MKTILEILNKSIEFLEKKGFKYPRREAQDLLSRMLSLKPMDLYLSFEKPLSEEEVELCRRAIIRRANKEPAAYIDGKVEFLNCTILVSPSVLIPRQETEILVDKVIGKIASSQAEGKVLWDICTGSGCIGISIKKHCPSLKVCLSDISLEALKVASLNVEKNRVDVDVLQGDLLLPFKGQKADFVVCNPPYVSEDEYRTLDKDVKEFEPKLALVGGKSGVEFYERLAKELPSYLKPSAKVWLELGSLQGEVMGNIFNQECWKVKTLEKDWAGLDRFFFLEIE